MNFTQIFQCLDFSLDNCYLVVANFKVCLELLPVCNSTVCYNVDQSRTDGCKPKFVLSARFVDFYRTFVSISR